MDKNNAIQKKCILLIVTLTLFFACREENREIVILGKITGKVPDYIAHTAPVNGVNYMGFKENIQLDSSGYFEIRMAIDKPSILEVIIPAEFSGSIIAEPGMVYSVTIDRQDDKYVYTVASNNQEGQQLYNDLPNRTPGHFQLEAMSYVESEDIQDIKDRIRGKQELELKRFRDLLDRQLISEAFYDLVKTDREYFYAGVMGSVALIKQIMDERQDTARLFTEDVRQMWEEVFHTHSLTNPELTRSVWFYYYVQNYLHMKHVLGNVDDKEDQGNSTKVKDYTLQIEKVRDVLPEPAMEYYYAAYIFFESAFKNYEKELIDLFDEFNDTYPSNEYAVYLKPEIDEIIAFHDKIAGPQSKEIRFIDDFDTVNSLEELAKIFEGKKLYIDIWATWCGPCKEEFKYKTGLRELLEANNFSVLYISIDRDEAEEKWREMISYYDLKGYHIRANKALTAKLAKLYDAGGSIAIPWYLLIDGEGNLVVKHASKPSDREKLEKELNEI